jgi:hypothetical protein
MSLQISPITKEQASKIVKALYYSAASGFTAGFVLVLGGVLPGVLDGTTTLQGAFVAALVTGGVVGALNSLAVTIKQLFTPAE